MSDLSTVFVKQFEQEETMKISFVFSYSNFPVQNFTFMRSKTERLELALTRMKSKIQSSVLQKAARKRKKQLNDIVDEVLPNLNIVLMKNGVKVDDNSPNIDAWTLDTEVVINDECFKIVVNPPSVIQISLPKCIISGFFVYPKVSLEFCSVEDCIFKWYRQITKENTNNQDNGTILKLKNETWKFISEGFLYKSGETDVGCKLRISCIPQQQNKSGAEEATVSTNAVMCGINKYPFEDRFFHTTELTKAGSYRFVSYNILADCYADTETAKNELFAHCPVEYLDVEYRKQLYLKEIIGYNADILCLQEVDKRIFQDDLMPVLACNGLKGIFNEKGGKVSEGLSCFYRDSKLKLIESHTILLSEAIKSEQVFHKLYSKISENEKLLERFTSRTTALQVTLFESLDVHKRKILVGNTHLFFHPDSDNIRLLQAASCLLYLENKLQKYQKEDPSTKVSFILCGDFNSCPEFGVYKLATEGFLPSSCIDWNSNPEEKVNGIDLSHSLQLKSACGRPQYTNYTQGFSGCLDYIFYDKSLLKVTQVVPFPTHEQVTKYVALPSQSFPSDHIALVSTLSWK